MTTTVLPAALTVSAGWLSDQDAYDPSAQIRDVTFEGVSYTVRNLLGPGWPMTIRHRGLHIGMAMWENWDEVEKAIRRHLEKCSA